MSRLGGYGNRLYRGEVSYDFVGRQKRWYAISALILLQAVIGLLGPGLHLGIEFKGGSEFQVRSSSATVVAGQKLLNDVGVANEPKVQRIGNNTLRLQTNQLGTEKTSEVRSALAKRFGVAPSQVSSSFVGPSWGRDVSTKALRGLVIFLVLLVIYLTAVFEWKMAAAALVALLHDIVITIGIYALVGFEVTPATVIGLLTILGYSLYDTVVVFDKVRENTAGITGGSRLTYSEAANLAINQTLVRSINTTLIALLPIAAILFVGAGLLGAGTLKDLSLSLFIGVAAGAYSSIFIATPLLADLKEREPAMQGLAKRVAQRRAGSAASARGGGTGKRPAAAAGRTGSTSTAVLDRVQDEADAAAAGDPVGAPVAGGQVSDAQVGVPDAQEREAPVVDVAVPGAARPDVASQFAPRTGQRNQPRRPGGKKPR